ncbi:MAG TPA: head-tail connector protein [Candidatus Sulfotelmatobacter sp.]|jgi:hypothetical protein|nr:head-tail connector protein [Candidatus Sulfotelmatobacter sp.]
MTTADLTSLDRAKAWLGLTDPDQTEDDLLLSWLITAASAFIASWCGRDFASQGYIETRDGTGNVRMPFANSPVTAVASLLIDNRPIPPGDPVSAPGYYFTPSMLMLNGFSFSRGLGNVVITYTAGLPGIPPDLEQACIELVGLRFREKDRIGLTSKGLAGESTGFQQADMPASVQTVLQFHKRILPL